jgi:hypothetical protein
MPQLSSKSVVAKIFFRRGKQDNHSETNSVAVLNNKRRFHSYNLFSVRPLVIFQPIYGYIDAFLLGVFFPNEACVYISHDDDDDDDIFINCNWVAARWQ